MKSLYLVLKPSRTVLPVLLMGILMLAAVTTNGQGLLSVDGNYSSAEYADAKTEYDEIQPASSTCDIAQVWAMLVTATNGRPLGVKLGFYNGNNGAALFRIYVDTDGDPETGLKVDTDLKPDFPVPGVSYVFEINAGDGTFAAYEYDITSKNELTELDISSLDIYGAAGDYDPADGKFFEISFSFDAIGFNVCDPNGVIKIGKYVAVSGGAIRSTICGSGTFELTVALAGEVTPNQTICAGDTPGQLTLSSYKGSIVEWEYSTDYDPQNTNKENGTWTSIPSTSALEKYTHGPLSESTYFRARISVPGGICSNSLPSDAALITVNPLPTPDAPANVTACDSYTLPALSADNYYYTGSGKTGDMKSAGDEITASTTLYVY
ncbi:hypothetical protein, partial [Mangrovibacterium lignilyticum]|uniref:hypothetical protein n=1 Tax=Mangrovibacterium lignilyticum TaxID=2668052 RepID=UPI0013D828DF